MRHRCPNPRQSSTSSVAINVAKTLFQVVVFWGFFLACLPWAIEFAEERLGFDRYDFPSTATRLVGGGLFLALSALGFGCGMMFAIRGGGTPLPLDGTTRFLVLGPYRYVRNPMAIAGIGQGISVGLYLGSPFVMLYGLTGAFAWQSFARRWEEADLVSRFGETYEEYRRQVRCWIPRLRPYAKIDGLEAGKE